MEKKKKIKRVEKSKEKLVLNFDSTEASENWLKYGRLKKLAEEGDEEARKEMERMDNSEMITLKI